MPFKSSFVLQLGVKMQHNSFNKHLLISDNCHLWQIMCVFYMSKEHRCADRASYPPGYPHTQPGGVLTLNLSKQRLEDYSRTRLGIPIPGRVKSRNLVNSSKFCSAEYHRRHTRPGIHLTRPGIHGVSYALFCKRSNKLSILTRVSTSPGRVCLSPLVSSFRPFSVYPKYPAGWPYTRPGPVFYSAYFISLFCIFRPKYIYLGGLFLGGRH